MARANVAEAAGGGASLSGGTAAAGRWLGRHVPRYSLLGVLVALYGFFWIVRPTEFGTVTNVRIIAVSQAVTLILALAVIFPLRAGDFDLSIGASMALSASVAGVLLRDHTVGVPLAILLALGAASLVGVLNASLVLGLGLPPFVTTLGTLIGVQGIALWLTDGQIIPSLPIGFTDVFAYRIPWLWDFPLAVVYGFVIAALIWYVFDQTRFGRHLLFLGMNRSAAARTGVRSTGARAAAFTLCGFLAGLGGLCFAALVGSVDVTATTSYLLPPYAAAFLGTAAVAVGRFNVGGTLIGVYVVAVGISGFQLLGASFWVANVFNGVALLAAVAVARFLTKSDLATAGGV
jgi:ribose transport system permease protein